MSQDSTKSSTNSSNLSSNRRRIKRKVHAAVGSLFADTTTTTDTSTALPTTLLSDSGALATYLAPAVRTKRARALLHSALAAPAASTCRPWSRDDFAQRVESYSPIKWFGKPPALSPLRCARYGWFCNAVDSLQCVTCGASVQPSDSPTDADESALSGSAHRGDCPWSKIAAPARFAAAPLDAESMRRQYRAALARLFALHRVPLLAPDTIARQLAVLRALPLYANMDCADVAKSDTLRCLAVHGWDASADGESLRCALCRRAVRVAELVAIDDLVAELPAERRDAPLFDVSSEHRAFCPWSQAAAHADMLRAFGARADHRQRRPQPERQDESLATLRAVKRILGDGPPTI